MRKALVLASIILLCLSQTTCKKKQAELEPVKATITAAQGGTLSFDDGTQLTIPPGALSADTEITLSRLTEPGLDPKSIVAFAVLAPDNLTLNAPATLVLPYSPEGIKDESKLLPVVVSHKNDLNRSSGEVNPFAIIDNATIDIANHRATMPISHFSSYVVMSTPDINLTLAIPGKYLHDGDILYALTDGISANNASALPMHVGMYVSGGTTNVIESTLPSSDCTPEFLEGVEYHTYEGKKGFQDLCGAHIFMGARIPPKVFISDSTRERVITAANSRLGKPYGIIALNDSDKAGIIVGGISCVELAEDSWEEAGINISWWPDAILWPHRQFASTVPVSSLEMKLSDGKLTLPVIGAVHVGKGRYRTGVGAGGVPMELSVTASPDVFATGRAQLVPGSSPQALRDLEFTPNEDDIGTVDFTFNLDVPSENVVLDEWTFKVQVKGDKKPPLQRENSCPANGSLCQWCGGLETGSIWDTYAMIAWSSDTKLDQLDYQATNLNTNEKIDWGLTFSSGTPNATLAVTRNKITGSGGGGRYRFADGTQSNITSADITLNFSGWSLTGTIVAHTEDGRHATVEVKAAHCEGTYP